MSEESGRPLPKFVRDELEGYLRCGILSYGCVRVRCGECGYDRLVAFSCKKRGIFGSCISRRMSETAAHLVDAVIPAIPMVHEPLDFVSKLVALIPPPRTHRITYSGVFAPRSKLRARIAPKVPRQRTKRDDRDICEVSHNRRLGWAKLMARVFAIDVLECPRCGAPEMQHIATIMDRAALMKLLRSVGLPADSPQPAPARLPQQPELEFAS